MPFLTGIVVCSVKGIFLFQGLVAAIPLAFIIPALCYMKLEEGPLLSQKKGPALLLALFGIAVTTFGTIVIMTKVIKNCSICTILALILNMYKNFLFALGICHFLIQLKRLASRVLGIV